MNGEFDIEHRQIERLFQEQHAMRGRARRDRQIEHESEEAEPQRLHALGRTVERGDQPRPLSCRARCRRFGKPFPLVRRRASPPLPFAGLVQDRKPSGSRARREGKRRRDRNGETVRVLKLLGMSQTRRSNGLP